LVGFFQISENLSSFSPRKLFGEEDILGFRIHLASSLQRNKPVFMNVVIRHVKDSHS
jgi:hypothetical protein